MCLSECLSVHDATFCRCLCILGLFYSAALVVQIMYAQQSPASSDQWGLNVDHFKAEETSYYSTLSVCCGLACATTLIATFVGKRTAMLTGVFVGLATCVTLFSLITCVNSARSHVVKNFMLVFDCWPLVAMICVLIHTFYVDSSSKNSFLDWEYLTDKFSIEW